MGHLIRSHQVFIVGLMLNNRKENYEQIKFNAKKIFNRYCRTKH
jgi:hypothetical protein